jgi:CheY-like chemotaxis protein
MKKRILFVEDDAAFRVVFAHAMREALADEGLDVAFGEAGPLAQARAAQGGRRPGRPDRRDDARRQRAGARRGDPRRRRGQPLPTLVLTASLQTSVAGRAMEAALGRPLPGPEATV